MSFNEPAIKVEGLSKCYHIYDSPADRLKQSVYSRLQMLWGGTPRAYFHEFWALRNVSFEVEKGETVGIIGRNGSGKSTLLQLICGTLTPTSGAVETRGRLAALLELGSGFNPEFSGVENIYLNGALLGLSKDGIDSRFDDIAAFADIGEFIAQPVKMYSSGMFIRLAFAINIMSQPDIMVVDEALAVGDMNFQAKCMTALRRRQEEGTTVLFVSHDIGSIKSLCSRGIYLEHGELKHIGPAANVAEHYIRVMREEMNDEQRVAVDMHAGGRGDRPVKTDITAGHGIEPAAVAQFERRVSQFRYGSGEAHLVYVELLDMNDEPLSLVEFDQEVRIRIYLEVYQPKTLTVIFNVRDDKKNQITGSNLLLAGHPLLDARPGDLYRVEYALRLPLQEGLYSVQTALNEPLIIDQTASFVDYVEDAVVFTMARREEYRVFSKVYLFPTIDVRKLSME
jgi:lipopolysaccharide transport system ATP-binding protein